MRRVLLQMLLLMVLAVIPAVVAGVWHPRRPALGPGVVADGEKGVEELRAARGPIVWIDARGRGEFEAGHVEGAVWLCDARWEEGLLAVMEAWEPGAMLVVYCDKADGADRRHVAGRLKRETELGGVYTLKGSWRGWDGANRGKEP